METFSNSLFLEKECGSSGFLVDANGGCKLVIIEV
jgi:hypothetical protein